MTNQHSIQHGHSSKAAVNPTYRSWCAMKTRCTNQNDKNYPRYGGRGISFCPSWESYDAFLRDMGERPQGMTLDRIDPNGNYEPANCRWATAKQQMDNQRKTVIVEWRGEKLTIADCAARTGLSKETIRRRLMKGLSADVALSAPAARGVVLRPAMAAKEA